jgi:septal ring factor EnvC (AmiA/AmiB activator)
VSVYNVLASGSAVIAIGTAVGVLYRGWRNRITAAAAAKATKPFTTSQAAIDEAELAIRLKDKRLADTTTDLETQRAKNSAQTGQINELYTELGKMTAKNAELEEKLEQAKVREETQAGRIDALETQVEGLMKQIGLGH